MNKAEYCAASPHPAPHDALILQSLDFLLLTMLVTLVLENVLNPITFSKSIMTSHILSLRLLLVLCCYCSCCDCWCYVSAANVDAVFESFVVVVVAIAVAINVVLCCYYCFFCCCCYYFPLLSSSICRILNDFLGTEWMNRGEVYS